MASSKNARLDGCFAVFKTAKKILSKRTARRQPDQVCDFFAKMRLPMVGLSDKTAFLQGESYAPDRVVVFLPATSRSREAAQAVVLGSTAEETSLWYERCTKKMVEETGCSCEDYGASPRQSR